MSDQGYIMLSYQWDQQPVVKKIRERLKENGYEVWIDIEKMDGYIFTTMSDAIENADVVLPCLSKSYENSVNCKRETTCITSYEKEFIPLLVDDYTFSGWITPVYGGDMHVKFVDEAMFDTKFNILMSYLRKYNGTLKPNPHLLQNPGADSTASSVTSESQFMAVQERKTPLRYDLSEDTFRQLLVNSSKKWKKNRKISMLKVLLCDFKITMTDIQTNNDPFRLFMLLEANAIISKTDIDVVVEAAILCTLSGVEQEIIKHVPNYPKFSNVDLCKFTSHRRNVIEFGLAIGKDNLETVVNLFSLEFNNDADI